MQTRRDPAPIDAERANHLALTAHGLPGAECPDGVWLVDVGLGDGLYGQLPLRAGTYGQGPFAYRLGASQTERGGWRFDHDPGGSFVGMDVRPSRATMADFTARHGHLSTSPESEFVRTCVLHRRDRGGVDSLVGCVLRRVGDDASERTLETASDWFAAIADVFGMPLTDVDAADRRALWARVHVAHEVRALR